MRTAAGGPGLDDARSSFLAEASRRLAASLDAEATLREVVDLAVPALAEEGAAYLLHADGAVRRVVARAKEAAWLASFEADGGVERVMTSAKPASLESGGGGATVVVPLVARGVALGALVLSRSAKGPFEGVDMRLAEDLGLRAGVALDNARTHERLARLQSVTSRLARPLTAIDVARILSDEAARSVGASTAILWLVNDTTGALEVVPRHSAPARLMKPFARLDLGADVPIAQAARTGEDVFVVSHEALVAWSGARDTPVEHAAWAAMALHDGGRTIGALLFAFPTPRAFPSEMRLELRALADQGAQALARTRLAEAALVRQQLLESQNESSLDAIFFQDAEGRPAFFNQRLLEVFGVPRDVPQLARFEDRLARSMESIADPAAFGEIAMRMEREPDASLRFEVALKDGRTVDAYTAPVRAPDGSRLGRAWYYRDVTEGRRLQRELFEARQQLSHREKLAAMGTLVSGVAHEIRTPLAYAANHAFLLDAAAKRFAGPEAAAIRTSAASIVEAVDRIDRLVQDLRRFTRFGPPMGSSTSLAESVREAARLFDVTHPERVRLDVKVEGTGPVAVDRVELQQVILNLLENAAEASGPRARVHLRARMGERMAEIEVADEGAGIPPEVQARMWEPFFTTKAAGTGLGLSIVRRIAETHGGSVRCESDPGRGARFVVAFPRADGAPAQAVPAPGKP